MTWARPATGSGGSVSPAEAVVEEIRKAGG